MIKIAKPKESDLFEPVKKWLEEAEYEVFSEVQPRSGGKRADVVGKNGKCICIVELKTSLTLDLMDQAYNWLKHAHYVYIAIPKRSKRINKLVFDWLHQHRIGLLEVDGKYVYEDKGARFNRPTSKKLNWEEILVDEHKTWLKGGSSGGGFVTEYKLTMKRVEDYLSKSRHGYTYGIKDTKPKDGWVTISQILDHCETHYRSPKPSLSNALQDIRIDWCETKKEKGRLWFRYKYIE